MVKYCRGKSEAWRKERYTTRILYTGCFRRNSKYFRKW